MGIATFPAGSSGISTASPQWVLLDSNTSTGAAATRTFSNISQSYNVLKVIASGYVNTTGSNYGVYWRINNDSSSVYSYSGPVTIYNSSYIRASGTTNIDSNQYGDNLRNNERFNYELTIFNYTSTSEPKLFQARMACVSGTGYGFYWEAEGSYRPSTAAAVTSIVLSGDSISTGQSANGFGLYLYGSR